MRNAYSRGGLAVIALYGIMSAGQAAGCVIAGAIYIAVGMMNGNSAVSEILNTMREENGQMHLYINMDSILQSVDIIQWVIVGLVAGMICGMLIGLAVMRKIIGKKNLITPEKKKLSLLQFIMTVLLAFGLWGIGAVLGNITEFFFESADTSIFSYAGDGILAYYAYAILGAPVLEELTFRKTLIDGTGKYGTVCSAFVSALLFGLIHGNSMQFPLAFCLGLLFSAVYANTGRIIYTILLHSIINLTATLPELFAYFSIEIDLVWNIVVLILILLGLVMIIAARKDPVLRLTRPHEFRANSKTFKNVGMRICCIAGTIALVVTDMTTMVSYLLSGYGIYTYLKLIPVMATIITVVLVTNTVGRHRRNRDVEETEILEVLA